MSIRPIDIVTIAPKSQEASQMHYNEVRGRNNAESAVAQTFDRTEKHDSRRTVQASKGETQSYRFDAKDGGNGSYSGNGKKKKKSGQDDGNGKKGAQNPYSGGGFDIMI